MPRRYTVETENVSVAAAQDLCQVIGAAGKTVKIKRVMVGATNTTLVTAQSIRLNGVFLPATVTNGSGGTAPTFKPVDPGDAAASVTAKANSTTQATTNGTAVTTHTWGVHIFAGLDFTFPIGAEPVVGPSESWVFGLLSTVTGTVNLDMTVEVEESGG
jgi:hypothetical protein